MQIEKNEAVGGNINCWVGTWAMSAFGSMNIFFWNWVFFIMETLKMANIDVHIFPSGNGPDHLILW